MIKALILFYNSSHWTALAPSAMVSDQKSLALTKAHMYSDAISINSEEKTLVVGTGDRILTLVVLQ